MSKGFQMLTAGERAIITVCGSSKELASNALGLITSNHEFARSLTPSPAPSRMADDEFGMSVAVQEFIIAVAAGFSVETLVATVRAALRHRPGDRDEDGPGHSAERISVEARQTGLGLVEVTVTIDKSRG